VVAIADPATAGQGAARAAEAIRALDHMTMRPVEPADLYAWSAIWRSSPSGVVAAFVPVEALAATTTKARQDAVVGLWWRCTRCRGRFDTFGVDRDADAHRAASCEAPPRLRRLSPAAPGPARRSGRTARAGRAHDPCHPTRAHAVTDDRIARRTRHSRAGRRCGGILILYDRPTDLLERPALQPVRRWPP
jgi:hypothetical protein